MNGHGGARAGAGRPQGGISAVRRRLVGGIERGLADAAQRVGIPGETREELVEAAIADIACSMVLSGRGAEVVALYAQLVARGEGGADGAASPLAAALDRLPGMVAGTGSAHAGTASSDRPVISAGCSEVATHVEGVAALPAPVGRLPVGPSLPLLDDAGRPLVVSTVRHGVST